MNLWAWVKFRDARGAGQRQVPAVAHPAPGLHRAPAVAPELPVELLVVALLDPDHEVQAMLPSRRIMGSLACSATNSGAYGSSTRWWSGCTTALLSRRVRVSNSSSDRLLKANITSVDISTSELHGTPNRCARPLVHSRKHRIDLMVEQRSHG